MKYGFNRPNVVREVVWNCVSTDGGWQGVPILEAPLETSGELKLTFKMTDEWWGEGWYSLKHILIFPFKEILLALLYSFNRRA